MNQVLEKLKTTKLLAGIGIIALLLATILPYAEFHVFGYSYSATLWNYWQGKVILFLTIANLLFIFKDIVEKYIPSLFQTTLGQKIQDLNEAKYSIIPTILIVIFALYLTFGVAIDLEYCSIGFYLLWIGIIALVAYAVLHRKNNSSVGNMP